jgi:hypothetical protein
MRGAVYEFCAVWVPARDVEEIDAGKDYEEAGEEREGVYGVGGVEAAIEDEGGAEGRGCEGYVVERVDAVVSSISPFPLKMRGVMRLGGLTLR